MTAINLPKAGCRQKKQASMQEGHQKIYNDSEGDRSESLCSVVGSGHP